MERHRTFERVYVALMPEERSDDAPRHYFEPSECGTLSGYLPPDFRSRLRYAPQSAIMMKPARLVSE